MTTPIVPLGYIAPSAWPASAMSLTSGLAALEAHVPESNSLYEYVAWKVFETAKLKPETGSLDRLMALFSRPHSLNDLADFAESARLRLTPSFTDACRLGDGFVRETFEEALARPEMRGLVRSALSRIAAGRLPDLMTHRLFHVLLSDDHEYKTAEFLHFSWDQKTTSVQSACVPHPEVKRTIAAVEEVVAYSAKGDDVERWKVWKKGLKKDERQFVADLKASLSSLIPGLNLVLKGPEEMKRLAEAAQASGLSRRHPAEPSENIVADYLLPEENGGRPAIVLLWPAPSRLVLEARAWHEATHLRQALTFGGDWVHRNLLIAEMWAYGAETRHRLDCGDTSLYVQIMGYSPFGYGLALRNFTEHMNLRQAAPF
ncbi:MAG TPA: hypothetical protein VFX30_08595 [bacterium]|nr:hypothetical protein [bacterium]